MFLFVLFSCSSCTSEKNQICDQLTVDTEGRSDSPDAKKDRKWVTIIPQYNEILNKSNISLMLGSFLEKSKHLKKLKGSRTDDGQYTKKID